MELPVELVERLNEWSGSPAGAGTTRIERRFVHKEQATNVFVARVAPLAPERPDEHVAELALDPAHPYYFEHAQDHVPGMMLLEAGRQLAMAIAHIYYDVSLHAVFVLEQMSSSFTRFADLGAPIFIHARVSDRDYRRSRLTGMSSSRAVHPGRRGAGRAERALDHARSPPAPSGCSGAAHGPRRARSVQRYE